MATRTMKLISKTIEKGSQSFEVYSLLSRDNKWYRISGVKVQEYQNYANKVVTFEVIRAVHKSGINEKTGYEYNEDVLQLTSIRQATPEEETAFYEDLSNAPENALSLEEVK